MNRRFIVFITLILFFAVTNAAQSLTELQRSFKTPPDEARIMMRWWWFGPAVTKEGIERELRAMKAGGIGGVEIQPVYALSLDDAPKGIKNLRYLSPEHLEMLRFAATKGRALGMRVDLTLGSGWPFGGPEVGVEHAASQLRIERVKIETPGQRAPLPSLGAGEQFLGAFLVNGGKFNEIKDIKDGAIYADGLGEAQFYIASRAGMQVKRPSIGAEGFVLDHLNRAATEHYLNTVGEKLIGAFGKNPPYSIFCDSLEVYNQDWSADFPAEFQRRRGYDLRPLLPALANDIGPETAEIRYDWGRTLTELYEERFAAPMQAWAKRHGTRFRVQNYGIPPASLSSSAYADLPDGEGAQWKVVRAARWAASASHIYGRRVTASETWTWLHSPSFRATPLDMKAEADIHFLQGINQFIGHGWPYTPAGVEYPGYRFYAAAVFNDKNPWWPVMPDISLYLQRVSHLMRQGNPANDVALYLPNADAYAGFSAGKVHLIDVLREHVGPDVMPRILESGYNLDFIDDGTLAQTARVEGNTLFMGESRYRAVVLPGVERIPPATLRKLEEFARAGGIVIATRRRPEIPPGRQATKSDFHEVSDISRRLFDGSQALGRFAPDENRDLIPALKAKLAPDMALSPAAPDVQFVRRHLPDADIYFIANTSNQRHTVQATFRNETQPTLWNAMNGEISPLQISARTNGGATVTLEFEPYQSRIVAFSKAISDAKLQAAKTSEAQSLDLTKGWQVTFGANGKPQMWDDLRSWTDNGETRYFSGTAVYEKKFNAPEAFLKSAQLDFGEAKPLTPQPLRNGMQTWLDAPVKEAAVVFVNGKRVGAVWCPPYRLELNGFLRSGENTLRIEVSNLALNYMAGRKLPDYRLLNLRYGERFQPQDMDKVQPVAAGLLGAVKLLAIK
jgi:hypothetical protein